MAIQHHQTSSAPRGSVPGLMAGGMVQSGEHVVPAERIMVDYLCDRGHGFSLPFSLDVGNAYPERWDCQCGAEAIALSGGTTVPHNEKAGKSALEQLHSRRTVEELEALLKERLALPRNTTSDYMRTIEHIGRARKANKVAAPPLSPTPPTPEPKPAARKPRPRSRYTGVRQESSGMYSARFTYKGKTMYLGTFESELEAARVRDAAAVEHGGTAVNNV